MNPMIDRLTAAVDTVREVNELAVRLPEDEKRAAEMSLHLSIATTYLVELAAHLARGAEPYDAVLSTVRGELNLVEPFK